MKWIYLLVVVRLNFVFSDGNLSAQTNETLESKYFTLGVPSTENSWTADDYKIAAIRIKSIMEADTIEFLKADSPILKKFLDVDSNELYNSTHIDLNKKFLQISSHLEANNVLLLIYLNAGFDEKDIAIYSEEIVGLLVSSLKVMGILKSLQDLFLTNNPDLTDQQKEGFKMMESGVNKTISGGLEILKKDYLYFRKVDICFFAEEFVRFYKNVENSLNKNSRNEFSKQLTNIKKAHTYDCIRTQ